MKNMNWEGVEESTPVKRPEPGGYVVRITATEDKAAREYVNLVYDIAEGPYAGFYSDDFGRRNDWAHRFVRSYKDSCEGMFKAFLARLAESNPNFSVAAWQHRCDVRDFVGLTLGIVLQYEDYTNESGEDKERLQVVGVYSVDTIRSGDYKVPARKDSRKAHGAAAVADAFDPAGYAYAAPGEQVPASVYDDLPFN